MSSGKLAWLQCPRRRVVLRSGVLRTEGAARPSSQTRTNWTPEQMHSPSLLRANLRLPPAPYSQREKGAHKFAPEKRSYFHRGCNGASGAVVRCYLSLYGSCASTQFLRAERNMRFAFCASRFCASRILRCPHIALSAFSHPHPQRCAFGVFTVVWCPLLSTFGEEPPVCPEPGHVDR